MPLEFLLITHEVIQVGVYALVLQMAGAAMLLLTVAVDFSRRARTFIRAIGLFILLAGVLLADWIVLAIIIPPQP